MAQRSPIFWLHNHGESANNFPEGMPHCQQLLHLFLKIAVGVLPESRNGSPSRSNVDILARTSRPATVLYRQVIDEALAARKRQNAKLVIAKLDRLSRNLAFIATLEVTDMNVCCASTPRACMIVSLLAGNAGIPARQSCADIVAKFLDEQADRPGRGGGWVFA